MAAVFALHAVAAVARQPLRGYDPRSSAPRTGQDTASPPAPALHDGEGAGHGRAGCNGTAAVQQGFNTARGRGKGRRPGPMATMSAQRIVYIVDDEQSMREALARLVRREGWRCHCFSSARGFLEDFQPQHAGCLVLDLRMPEMDGLTLLRTLREQSHTVPVIFLTAYGTIQQAVRAIKDGAVQFFEKPADPQTLITAIATALSQDRDTGPDNPSDPCPTVAERIATLSAREREVADLIVAGHTSASIAKQLFIAEGTVKVHRAHIMKKMGADSVADLVRMMMQADRPQQPPSPPPPPPPGTDHHSGDSPST